MRKLACFTDIEARKEIQRLCRENEVDINLLTDLCEVISMHSGSGRKEGVVEEITQCIDRLLERTQETT